MLIFQKCLTKLLFCVLFQTCIHVTVVAVTNFNAESRLIKDLFTGYSTNVKPTINPHANLTVDIDFSMGRIESINERQQTITTTGWLITRWKDESLIWDPQEYNQIQTIVVSGKDIWLPELTLQNGADGFSDLSFDSNKRAVVDAQGNVYWYPAFQYETTCSLDLTYFPFDTQTCNVTFYNDVHGYQGVILKPVTNYIRVFYENNTDWHIETTLIDRYQIIDSGIHVQIVSFSLTLRREPTFYVWNVLIPTMLMTLLTLLVFFLPSDSGEKLGLSTTVFLGYSVVLLMLSETMPRSSATMPMLFRYSVQSMVISGLCISSTIITLNVHHHSGQVPTWVRRVFLQKLGHVLCMGPSSSDHNDRNSNQVRPVVSRSDSVVTAATDGYKQKCAQNNIPSHLLNEDGSSTMEQWQQLAAVLDRLFFIAYLVVIVSLMAQLICSLAFA